MRSDPDTTVNEHVTIVRTFDAPRPLVYEAWTDPQQMAQWFGPHGFTNPHCELDVRPGGVFSIDMLGPDGTIYPCRGVFDEVVAPEKLVFTTGALPDEHGDFAFEIRNTVTFEERDGKTVLTLQADVLRFEPVAIDALSGMEEGWNQSFERLDDLLAKSEA